MPPGTAFVLPRSQHSRREQREQANYEGIMPVQRPRTPGVIIRPKSAGRANEVAFARAQIDARRRLHGSTAQGRMEATRAVSLDHARRELASAGVVPHRVRLAFNAFDRNRSGFLGHRELRSALRHYGIDANKRESMRIIHAYDERPDGRMDLDEFHRLCQDLEAGHIRAAAAPAYDPSVMPARVKEAFYRFDTNGDGYIDRRELRGALRHYGLDANAAGAGRVLAAYDKRPDGRLDAGEFAKLVRDLESGQVSATRAAVPARARRTFESFDRDRDGYLSYRELRNALRFHGVDVDGEQARGLIASYDDRPDGQMDVHEFSALVQDLELGMVRTSDADRPGTPMQPWDRPVTPMTRPGTAAAQRSIVSDRVQEAFDFFDTNGDGYIDRRELRGALRHYGLDANAAGAGRVLAAYDKRPDGRLDAGEFAKLVRDLESGQVSATRAAVPARARRTFESFDRDRDGYLSYRELRNALRFHGVDVDGEQARGLIASYDDRPDGQMDVHEFSALVQDLELGMVRTSDADRPGTPMQPWDRPVTPMTRPGTASSASVVAESEDLDSVYGDDPYAFRRQTHRQTANDVLRQKLRMESQRRKAAEAEAEAARHLAALARRKVDGMHLSNAERALDEAMMARRRTLGMLPDDEASYMGLNSGHYLKAGDVGRRGRAEPPMSQLMAHPQHPPPSRPGSAPGVPLPSRSETSLSGKIAALESAILGKLDAKSGADSDQHRAAVLMRIFRSVDAHGDRYVGEAEFAAAIGRLTLGASSHAGVRGANPHLMVPAGMRFDVDHATLGGLFDKYSQRVGSEMLVDVEQLYAQMKRNTQPAGALRELTSLETEATKLERELMDHPWYKSRESSGRRRF